VTEGLDRRYYLLDGTAVYEAQDIGAAIQRVAYKMLWNGYTFLEMNRITILSVVWSEV
jgi:hypothetical protein